MHLAFRYNSDGLIPVIVQEADSPKRVLMLAWMNRETIVQTLETGFMHYWSRSRGKAWKKGETSGHVQRVRRWFVDCDDDTLLFEVEQVAGACHTGYRSCFFREMNSEGKTKPVDETRVFDPEKTYVR
jgi:phosphoribosyl-AMP cyclohydrolase